MLVALALALAAASATARAGADIRAHGVPSIRAFGADDGIPQSSINAIAFEPGGRLWVGTQGGPASYDGRRFTPLELPTEGASSWVQAIAATHDGAVWFGMMTGHAFRYAAGSFTRFGPAEGLTSAKAFRTIVEAPARGGRALWGGTLDGLYVFEGARWARVELGPGFEHPDVRALSPGTLPDGQPTLWVGTGKGLLHCEDRRCAPLGPGAELLAGENITSLLETISEGRRVLWAGTRKGLCREVEGRWELFAAAGSPLPAQLIRSIAETVSGSGRRTLWLGTHGGGLARHQDGVWTTLTAKNAGLPDDFLMTVVPSGGAHGARTLWIGTNSRGLARLRHDGWVGFTERNTGMSGILLGVAEIAPPGGAPEIWISAGDQIWRSSGQGFAPVLPPAASAEISSLLHFLLPSRREPGVVWTGGFVKGLHRWANGQLTTFDRQSSSLPHDAVHCAYESLDGRTLWVGTGGGGAARLEADGKGQVFRASPQGLADDHVNAILETARPGGPTTTWFGTYHGLSRLEGGAWRSYTAANSPLGADFIETLAELRDARGARILWIGTMDGGVARYDLDAEAWLSTLSERSSPALPDRSVYSVRADAQGRVYLGTTRGVARLTPRAPTPDDRAEFSVYTFTREDGLPDDECNANTSWVDSRGRIWVGTIGGAAVFDPAEEVPDSAPRPLAITAARAAGGALALLPGASLAWDQNTVSFESTLLSFLHERSSRYRTQLLGFDPAPGEWTADPRARYTNLPPGAYTFQVWARDHGGAVAGPAAIAFQVRPAPWLTWWAYLGYAAALAGVVVGGVRLRLRALRRRNHELELQVEQRTTELKAAKEAADAAREVADAANHAKTSFLASMSHELRTPLNGILGYAQLLQRDPRLPAEARSSVAVVRRSGEHLLNLIDDVLDLARIESGRLDLVPADVHLPSLAEGVADLCRVRAAERGITFQYVHEDSAPAWVRADEKRLTQVLLNLVGNALKFTREGRVALRVTAKDEEVVFGVEDTGPGIAPADVARIFEPFEQAGERRARAEGAGLGLAISRRIVEQMGGRIDVKSAPGEGSTFSVALPLPVLAGRAPSSAQRSVEAITGYEGARRAILVVDDHEDNRAFLRDALAPLGFEVLEAAGGEPAVALAAERRPDLVLMDLHMPDLGGDEAARRIRQIPGLAGLPIIATSASVEEPQRARSAAAGCDAFLPKPIHLPDLFDLLQRRLDLAWIRAAPEPDRAPAAPSAGPVIPPPPEVLARLAELVELGRIQDLAAALSALEAEDPRLAPWVAEARSLAEGFRLRELLALLAPEGPAPA